MARATIHPSWSSGVGTLANANRRALHTEIRNEWAKERAARSERWAGEGITEPIVDLKDDLIRIHEVWAAVETHSTEDLIELSDPTKQATGILFQDAKVMTEHIDEGISEGIEEDLIDLTESATESPVKDAKLTIDNAEELTKQVIEDLVTQVMVTEDLVTQVIVTTAVGEDLIDLAQPVSEEEDVWLLGVLLAATKARGAEQDTANAKDEDVEFLKTLLVAEKARRAEEDTANAKENAAFRAMWAEEDARFVDEDLKWAEKRVAMRAKWAEDDLNFTEQHSANE